MGFLESDRSMDYASFKAKYEADAVSSVIAKQPVDLSIPYDAAAQFAYLESDRSMDYASFKAKYEADAIAAVMAKRPKKEEKEEKKQAPPPAAVEEDVVDLSIPYDAAA